MKACSVDECEKAATSRGYCQMHYRRVLLYGDPNVRLRHWSGDACEVEDCKRPPKGRYCPMHRRRVQRNGSPYRPEKTGRHVTDAGYQMVKRPGHPVARSNGWALEHRVVLFDAIGPGAHPCHWCGKSVSWEVDRKADALVVDHLDDVKWNNDRDNLVPSCHRCNTSGSYVIQRVRIR